jgi:hypothetical protein
MFRFNEQREPFIERQPLIRLGTFVLLDKRLNDARHLEGAELREKFRV